MASLCQAKTHTSATIRGMRENKMNNAVRAASLLLGLLGLFGIQQAGWAQASASPSSSATTSADDADHIVRYDAKCLAEEMRRCLNLQPPALPVPVVDHRRGRFFAWQCPSGTNALYSTYPTPPRPPGYDDRPTPPLCLVEPSQDIRAWCERYLQDVPPTRCERKEFTTLGWARFMAAQSQRMEEQLQAMCLAAGHKPEVCARKVAWPGAPK